MRYFTSLYAGISWPLTLTAFLLGMAVPRTAIAQPAVPGALRVSLPFDLVDTLDGAKFKIRVPANWNGTLLLYLLGLKMPGPPPSEPALVQPEDTLLRQGYALAASAVATDDWQGKEEVQDTLALTAYFKARIGTPARIILMGASLGSMAALRLIEEFPRSFDAAIPACTLGAGVPRAYDVHLDKLVAYAAVFGLPPEWGTAAALKPGLDFMKDIMPKVQWPKPDGSNRSAWEFIRLVTGQPAETFWGTEPLAGTTGFMLNMFLAVGSMSSMEAFAAGPFAQNLDHYYTLRPGR